MRTQFEKIIIRAGLKPWARLFHNLRSSRQTELTDRFPAHVVASWLGNSEAIARKHYLQTTDSHFKAATDCSALQNALQLDPELGGNGGLPTVRKCKKPRKNAVSVVVRMDDTGLEPVTSTMSTWRSNQLS